jgi:SAM-dependent methyltransferase
MKNAILRVDQRRRLFRSIKGAGQLFDIGCGLEENAHAIHSMFPTLHRVDRLDPSAIPDFIQYKETGVEQQLLPYPDSHFDVVILAHVLEHLDDLLRLGPEIKSVRRVGGRVHIETPNWVSIFIPSFAVDGQQLQTLNSFDDRTFRKPWSRQGIYERLALCCG